VHLAELVHLVCIHKHQVLQLINQVAVDPDHLAAFEKEQRLIHQPAHTPRCSLFAIVE
jgi:hypothetical protein